MGVKDDVIPTEADKNAEINLIEGVGAGAGSETRVLRYPDGVHMQDLESALHYTFRMEIPRMTSIQGPALQALKDLIRILAKVRFLASWILDVPRFFVVNDSSCSLMMCSHFPTPRLIKRRIEMDCVQFSGDVHTAQKQTPKQIPVGFCAKYLCLSRCRAV